jgi:hypothetical protein
METGQRFDEKEDSQPFSGMSDDARYWQSIYSTAVVIAQEMQRNGFDPYEASEIRPDQIHAFFMSCRIYSFDEQLIFDIAVKLLKDRHDWSYGNRKS